ncbi:MAG: Rieske (2Fe-2S) protein [Alphaproteobacteria bacterium]|jgi:nitrite reductase (NADH) small subunit
MTEYVIGRIQDIPDRGSVAVKAGNQVIAVFRSGETLYAVHNTCPHKGGLICDGDFEPENKIIRCPLHLWGWRLDTGELETDPRQQIRTYDVKVVDGEVVLSA